MAGSLKAIGAYLGLLVIGVSALAGYRVWVMPRVEASSALVSVAVQAAATGQTEAPYYYGWKNEKVPLELSSDQVWLTFKQYTSAQQYDALFAAHNLYTPADPNAQSTGVGPNIALRVCPVAGLDVPASENAFAALAGLPQVSRAFRTYRVGSEEESLLTDQISIVVNASDEAAVLGLIVQEGGILLYRSDYTGTGEVGLKVQVPRAEQMASGESVVERANRYHRHPSVKHASPCFTPMYSTTAEALHPNDEKYCEVCPDPPDPPTPEWYFAQQNMAEAWGHVYDDNWGNVSSAPKIIVASMDNGIPLDYSSGPGIPAPDESAYLLKEDEPVEPMWFLDGHPDLIANQWFNSAEVGGTTGVDDDCNGYIDDYFGWDFVGNDPTAGLTDPTDEPPCGPADGVFGDNIPFPDYYANPIFNRVRKHGTSMAGKIAATTDNDGLGMPGMCPSCLLMPIRYHVNTDQYSLTTGGSGLFFHGRIEQGINYAVDNGATVLAMLFVVQTYDPMVHAAIRNARSMGRVMLAPTGNHNQNMDTRPRFPLMFPEVISVGASNQNYQRSTDELTHLDNDGSNYGWVLDVVSPSEQGEIWGTNFQYDDDDMEYKWEYGRGGGTSSSFPQAAGIAGLVLTANPALSPLEVQVILQETADSNIDPNFCYDENDPNSCEEANLADPTNDPPLFGRDRFSGWGLLQADKAVERATIFKHQFFVTDDTRPVVGRRSIMSVDPTSGDFIFDGPIVENATGAQLAEDTSVNDITIAGVARLDLTGATLYLKGTVMDNAHSSFEIPEDAPFVMAGKAYISAAGDLVVWGRHYSTSNIDRIEADVTVLPPLTTMSQDIQDAVTAASDGAIIIVPPGTYTFESPLNFGTKNVVLQSTAPYDFAVADATILRAGGEFRTIELSTAQTEHTAIKGFRIEGDGGSNSGGIKGFGSTAHILYNIFVNNKAEYGGAIQNVDGLIEGNMFEGNEATGNGGALAACDAIIVQNVFWYNTAGGGGGAISNCDGPVIQANFIGENSANNGGGLWLCDTEIRSNIIWNNVATTLGGGLHECGTLLNPLHIIEQNTIYGNRAGDGFGMYDCDPGTNRNNILWANTDLLGAGGEQMKFSTEPVNCAVDQSADPGGINNIGPNAAWSFPVAVTDLKFVSEALVDPMFTQSSQSMNWHEFLHIDGTSACIDSGQTLGNPPNIFRDIDDKLGPLDGNSSSSIERDIGAHEYPSPITIEDDGANDLRILEPYWWKRF